MSDQLPDLGSYKVGRNLAYTEVYFKITTPRRFVIVANRDHAFSVWTALTQDKRDKGRSQWEISGSGSIANNMHNMLNIGFRESENCKYHGDLDLFSSPVATRGFTG